MKHLVDRFFASSVLRAVFRLRYVLLLGLISALTVAKVALNKTTVNGDLHHYAVGTIKAYNSTSIWSDLGSGSVNLNAWRAPYYVLVGMLTDYRLIVVLAILLPLVLLAATAPYYFFRSIIYSPFVSFVMSAYVIANTYFLSITSQGHYLIVIACYLLLLSIGFIFRSKDAASDRAKLRHYLAASLALTVCGYMDFRVVYLSLPLLLFALLYSVPNVRSFIKAGFFVFIPFVFNNIFWLAVFGSTAGTSSAVLGRSLFGSQYQDLRHALTAQHPFWSYNEIVWFDKTGVSMLSYALLFVALGIMYRFRRNKLVVLGAVVYVLGVFLSKQVSQPFAEMYEFMYDYLPGFNAFRESTKFYFLTTIGLAIVVGAGLKELRSKAGYKLFAPLCGLVLLLVCINLFSSVTGNSGNIYTSREPSLQYTQMDSYIQDESDVSRTLVLPVESQYHYGTNAVKTISGTALRKFETPQVQNTSESANIMGLLNSNSGRLLINSMGIKNIVAKDREFSDSNELLLYYGNEKDYFNRNINGYTPHPGIDSLWTNQDYQQYVSTYDSLTTIPEYYLLDKYIDLDNQKNVSTGYVVGDNSRTFASRFSYDLFDITNKFKELSANQVSTIIELPAGHDSSYLYANEGPRLITHRTTLQGVEIAVRDIVVNTDGGTINVEERGNDNHQLLPLGRDYIVSIDNVLVDIDETSSESRKLGIIRDSLQIYAKTKNEHKEDFSQYSALAIDCNSGHSLHIGADIGSYSTGARSLNLSADDGIACVDVLPATVLESEEFILEFEAGVHGGQRLGYDLIFDTGMVQAYDINVNDSLTRKYQYIHSTPPGTTSVTVRLKGMGDERRLTRASTHYNYVILYNTSKAYDSQIQPRGSNPIKLASDKTDFTYTYTSTEEFGSNAVPNSTFDTGLWQDKVADCNYYDNNTTLSMGSYHRGGGDYALELTARRHIACTNTGAFGVDEMSVYKLSLDGYGVDSGTLGYYMQFNDSGKSIITERIPVAQGNTWQHVERIVRAPYGATEVDIYLYGYSKDGSDRVITTRYDNVDLRQIPDLEGVLSIVAEKDLTLTHPASVAFNKLSSTRTTATVKGALGDGYYLAMSEGFHSGWQASLVSADLKNNEATVVNDHFKLNGWQNGWYVPVADMCSVAGACTVGANGGWDMQLVLEFAPAAKYKKGAILSAITVALTVGCVVYLCVAGKKRPSV